MIGIFFTEVLSSNKSFEVRKLDVESDEEFCSNK